MLIVCLKDFLKKLILTKILKDDELHCMQRVQLFIEIHIDKFAHRDFRSKGQGPVEFGKKSILTITIGKVQCSLKELPVKL